MSQERYDIVIIGTGAGGGALLSRLAPSGKRILVLERGQFLPREKQNWESSEVFLKTRYHTDEVWKDKAGKNIHPGTGYWVGGNTKVYGAALFRLRERDFERVQHIGGGVSPEWPLSYRDLEQYYGQAESLFHVHGRAGEDPTEPFRSTPYPHPPVSHEPRIQEVHDALVSHGRRPFSIPLGVNLNEADRITSPCIRCNTCDGFPCLVNAKSDSDVLCVRPALAFSNVTLRTGAKATRVLTNPSGSAAVGVELEVGGSLESVLADVVVVACGAINSAALLLRSRTDVHWNGLANSSDQVGRNFMKHHNGSMMAVSKNRNPTVFQKTIAVNDFYWGEAGFASPMGHAQLLGKIDRDMLVDQAPAVAPTPALALMATHSIDWWITAEDLPRPDNRVRVDGETVVLEYEPRDTEGFERMMARWKQTLGDAHVGDSIFDHSMVFGKTIPLESVGHQCGTCRFGTDPRTSVLDVNCRAHDVANLYVVDGSFFPSSGAVNPSLTIIANALRVGDHLLSSHS